MKKGRRKEARCPVLCPRFALFAVAAPAATGHHHSVAAPGEALLLHDGPVLGEHVGLARKPSRHDASVSGPHARAVTERDRVVPARVVDLLEVRIGDVAATMHDAARREPNVHALAVPARTGDLIAVLHGLDCRAERHAGGWTVSALENILWTP